VFTLIVGVRRQIISGTWLVLSRRPNDKAPEVLKTPGASFLGSGGALRHSLHASRVVKASGGRAGGRARRVKWRCPQRDLNRLARKRKGLKQNSFAGL
jgi:hypothetical protein